jgi:hypothetical protein
MKSFKPFLYVIYTLMFLITVLLMFNNDGLVELVGSDRAYRFWMYWALVGFILLMLESVFENIHISSVRRKHERLNRENLELKAKLYDKHVSGENPTMLPSRPYTDDKDRL